MISLGQRRTSWAVALLVIVAVALISFVSARRYVAAQAAVHHTLAVRQAIGDTLGLLTDAETGARGYLLTGDPDYLAPYLRARRSIFPQIAHLRELTRGDDAESRSALLIESLAIGKLEVLSDGVELLKQNQGDRAASAMRAGPGRRLMEAVRAEAGRMLAEENARLAERERLAERGERETAGVLLLALALISGVVGVGLSTLRRQQLDAKRLAERVLQSEKAYRSLADNASDLVRILGPDGAMAYVSPSSEALLGYTAAELVALTRDELLHPDEIGPVLAAVASLRRGEVSQATLVHRMRAKDGQFRWVETRAHLASDEDGEAGRIHLTSRDVSDRKLAEEALSRQTARLESILSSMGDGVVVLDENRKLLVVNPAAREYIHQEEGAEVPVDWAARHRTFDIDGVTPFASDHGPLTRALRGEACDGVEVVIEDRRGGWRSFSISARPLREDGRPAGCVAVYRDITAQREGEKELLEGQQRWRILSEASFEGIVISQDGVILDTNANFAAWMGRAPEELVGVDSLTLVAPEDRKHARAMGLQMESVFETQLLRGDGRPFPVEVRGRDALIRGKKVRIAVLRDITEKRRREAELRHQAELLRALSLRDELTGLYNRRGFLEHARHQLVGAVRARRPAVLFFADLDGMKKINDGFGHDAGDRAVRATAAALAGVFRQSDIVARLGGDEFAVFAPECAPGDVAVIRARLQVAIDAWNDDRKEPFRLSISVGAAAYEPGTPVTLDRLMETADCRMYEEKHGASPGPPSGEAAVARASWSRAPAEAAPRTAEPGTDRSAPRH
jgi:diguanylate cyclase (GGDEF)-like protein/PAS domain S-box-containing protein